MGLETATYISQLVATNPITGDQVAQGDDHLRLIKSTLQATLPNLTGAMTATHTELNYVVGVTSAIQTQLNAKLASASYTAADVLAKLLTVDGAGSGLDADLLDGLSSAAFATASHAHSAADLTSGSIPDARVPLSNVTQHQANLVINFTQLAGSIANGQVPVGAVTQHQASLSLAASQIASGTINTARLGSFTADSTKFLRGDSQWVLFDLGNIGGQCSTAQVPQACVTQHQAALTIGASQLTGTLADARVAQSNVTQHAAAILASAALTGNPTAPTPTAGDNDTSIATTAFIQTALGNFVKGGSVTVGLGSSATVTFPTAFPTACDAVVVTPDDTALINQYAWAVSGVSATGFTIYNQGHNGGTFYWMAKGS